MMHGYLWHEVSDAYGDFIESLHECMQRSPLFLSYVEEGQGRHTMQSTRRIISGDFSRQGFETVHRVWWK